MLMSFARSVMNLLPSSKQRLANFARTFSARILGTDIVANALPGEYDGDKLINLGTTRWALKLEFGSNVSSPSRSARRTHSSCSSQRH